MGESPGVLAGEDPADQDLPNQDGRERVLLVYERAAAGDQTGLTEAVALVEAAGAQLLLACSARVRRPNPRTFIASGKVAEIADLVAVAICHHELSWNSLESLHFIKTQV